MKTLTMEQMARIEGGGCSFWDVLGILGFATAMIGSAVILASIPATASLWFIAGKIGWATLGKIIGVGGFISAVQNCTSS